MVVYPESFLVPSHQHKELQTKNKLSSSIFFFETTKFPESCNWRTEILNYVDDIDDIICHTSFFFRIFAAVRRDSKMHVREFCLWKRYLALHVYLRNVCITENQNYAVTPFPIDRRTLSTLKQ